MEERHASQFSRSQIDYCVPEKQSSPKPKRSRDDTEVPICSNKESDAPNSILKSDTVSTAYVKDITTPELLNIDALPRPVFASHPALFNDGFHIQTSPLTSVPPSQMQTRKNIYVNSKDIFGMSDHLNSLADIGSCHFNPIDISECSIIKTTMNHSECDPKMICRVLKAIRDENHK